MKPILVVDDDEAIQAFVSLSLANEGFSVRLASDGMQALKLVAEDSPALILLDMRMPNMNGREFINAYHQTNGPHAPIVVMTAGRSKDSSTDALNIQGILAKPFDLDDLLKLVENITGS